MKPFSSEMQNKLEELRKGLTNTRPYELSLIRYFGNKIIPQNSRLYAGSVEANEKTMIGAVMSKSEDRLIEQIVRGGGIYDNIQQLNFVIEDDISVDAKPRKRNRSLILTEHDSYIGKWHDVKNDSNKGVALILLWTGELDIRGAQILAEL